MPDRRIHLRDYSEAELREMPAGALCDWLTAQAVHGPPRDEHGQWRICHYPHGCHWTQGSAYMEIRGAHKYSTKWSAAGPLLERLMRENGVYVAPSGDRQRFVAWRRVAMSDSWGDDESFIDGPEPQLAICRAALVIARRKIGGAS